MSPVSDAMSARPFRILGVQQIAIGALSKQPLSLICRADRRTIPDGFQRQGVAAAGLSNRFQTGLWIGGNLHSQAECSRHSIGLLSERAYRGLTGRGFSKIPGCLATEKTRSSGLVHPWAVIFGVSRHGQPNQQESQQN